MIKPWSNKMLNHIAELKQLNRKDFFDEANLHHLRRVAHDNPLALAIVEMLIEHGVPSIAAEAEDELSLWKGAYYSVAGEDYWADEASSLADTASILRGKRSSKAEKESLADKLDLCIEKMEECMKQAAQMS